MLFPAGVIILPLGNIVSPALSIVTYLSPAGAEIIQGSFDFVEHEKMMRSKPITREILNDIVFSFYSIKIKTDVNNTVKN
jgi:hypothetical protein